MNPERGTVRSEAKAKSAKSKSKKKKANFGKKAPITQPTVDPATENKCVADRVKEGDLTGAKSCGSSDDGGVEAQLFQPAKIVVLSSVGNETGQASLGSGPASPGQVNDTVHTTPGQVSFSAAVVAGAQPPPTSSTLMRQSVLSSAGPRQPDANSSKRQFATVSSLRQLTEAATGPRQLATSSATMLQQVGPQDLLGRLGLLQTGFYSLPNGLSVQQQQQQLSQLINGPGTAVVDLSSLQQLRLDIN